MWTPPVVLPDVGHAELHATSGVSVATRVQQAARYRLQRDVARLQQRLATVRALVASRELEVGPAAGADVVSGVAQCGGRHHVLATQLTCQDLEDTLTHGRLCPRR